MKNEVNADIAHLESLIGEAKPGDFEGDTLFENKRIWEILLLNRKKLEEFRDVSGHNLKGTRYLYDENNEVFRDENDDPKFVEVDFEDATDEELKNTIIRKFLAPGMAALIRMSRRIK